MGSGLSGRLGSVKKIRSIDNSRGGSKKLYAYDESECYRAGTGQDVSITAVQSTRLEYEPHIYVWNTVCISYYLVL